MKLGRGALLVALVAHTGCGYSLAGRGSFLPAYIQRIGVPQFVNHTAVFDLDRQVTERVRTEFIGRGKYTIVPDATGVDALLTGTISSVTLTPVAFNTDQQATRYALTLTATVRASAWRTSSPARSSALFSRHSRAWPHRQTSAPRSRSARWIRST